MPLANRLIPFGLVWLLFATSANGPAAKTSDEQGIRTALPIVCFPLVDFWACCTDHGPDLPQAVYLVALALAGIGNSALWGAAIVFAWRQVRRRPTAV